MERNTLSKRKGADVTSSAVAFRAIGAVVFGLAGWALAVIINDQDPPMEGPFWLILLSVIGFDIGLGLGLPPQGLTAVIKRIPGHALFGAIVGLMVAVVISAFLALPFSLFSGELAKIIPAAVFLLLAYFSITTMILRSRDVALFFGLVSPLVSRLGGVGSYKVILDTNAVIDGRVPDIVRTGFVRGTLIVPRFVLAELQAIADSSDPARRVRGRRGLDMLKKLQEEPGVMVQIMDIDYQDVREVDGKLVKLARMMRCPIVTNDINLSRVASLLEVKVLNINELANALKPMILPNDELMLKIIQEGKEEGQGIGYLDDGTIVVVEEAKQYIGQEITVTVTRILQTPSGRMIFAVSRNQTNGHG